MVEEVNFESVARLSRDAGRTVVFATLVSMLIVGIGMPVSRAGDRPRVTLLVPVDMVATNVLAERPRIEHRAGVYLAIVADEHPARGLAAVVDERADVALVFAAPGDAIAGHGAAEQSRSAARLRAFAVSPGVSLITLGEPPRPVRAVIEAMQSVAAEPNMAERE